jgi:hypothetical protein
MTYYDCMSLEKKAIRTLRDAERTLRGLVAEAAGTGDYAGAIRVAGWAKSLAELTRSEVTPAPSASPKEKKARRSTSEKYPIFSRRSEHLVRTAWSKKSRSEYDHKVNQATLIAVAAAIAEKGKAGGLVSTDFLLPMKAEDGAEIPNYQVYVCLSFLKKVNLIDQHGRRGYSVLETSDLPGAAERAWKALGTGSSKE